MGNYVLNEKANEILNKESLKQYHRKWFEKMNDVFEGKNHEPLWLKGIQGECAEGNLIYTNPKMWMKLALENLAERAEKAVSENRFVPLCVESALYGVHFIDKILGAEVFFQDGQWYNFYLKDEVGELQRVNLDENETWKLAKEVACAFLEQEVSVPLFGLPTIASALNIGVNLYGEEILVAMLVDPEAASHDLEVINDLLIEIHQWYRAHIPEQQLQPVISWERTQPYGYGQLCGCTTQLLSPQLYEEFLFDLDNELLGVYPNGGMIHLCGSHTQLLPLFSKMEHLKSVQLNDRAAEDLAAYVSGLREDQVIYLNPCEGMTIEKAKNIAQGRRLILVAEGV